MRKRKGRAKGKRYGGKAACKTSTVGDAITVQREARRHSEHKAQDERNYWSIVCHIGITERLSSSPTSQLTIREGSTSKTLVYPVECQNKPCTHEKGTI